MNKQIDIEDLQVKNIRYENIEIGDYVRFIDYDFLNTGKEKTVKIGKVKCKYSDIIEIKLNKKSSKIIKTTTNEILKVKKNIIELIEEGDYVNGEKVDLVGKDMILAWKGEIAFSKSEIKSIVTKEQFESVKYKV